MPKLKDISGEKFGLLTVLERDVSRKGKATYWLCKCDCGSGKIVSVARGSLTQGLTKSCGCLKRKAKKMNKYDLSGEYGVGWTFNTNKEFYFDLEDYEKIKGYCWYENDNGYIVTQNERKTIRMHRLVMGIESRNIQIDHVFHNVADNRKEFLRLASNMENCWNKKCTGYYFSKEKQKYVVRLVYKGECIMKYFDNENDAKEYRKLLEKEYYKEFAYKEKGDSEVTNV